MAGPDPTVEGQRPSSLRLFVAIEIPEKHKISIEKAIQPVRLALQGPIRWVPRESWHATVKFLGQVPEQRLPRVAQIIERVAAAAAPVETKLTDLGAFPGLRRARVLWVGLDDPVGALVSLASSLEKGFGRAGFRKESRALRPHVTIARLRAQLPVAEALAGAGPLRLDASAIPVDDVVLFRSHLSSRGAAYEAVARFPLGSPPPAREGDI